MTRLKSDPQRSWTAISNSKPFLGTILRNSLSPASSTKSNGSLNHNSSGFYQVRTGLHPLGPLGEFNDIQRCITEAILVHGQPCPLDYILDFVSARWKSLQSSEGCGRWSDPRKATMANLNPTSTTHTLFEQAKGQNGRWVLVTALPKAENISRPASRLVAVETASAEDDFSSVLNGSTSSIPRDGRDSKEPTLGGAYRSTRSRRNKRKREDGDAASSSSDDELPVELPGGRDAAYLLDLPRKKPKVYTAEELSYDASLVPPDELLERVKESKLTNLQILISISIIRSANFEARLDYILDFVCQHYTYLLGRDGNPKATDPKRAVLASLSKNASSSPLFVKMGDVWKIGPKNVLYGSKDVIPGLMEYITVSKAPGEAVELTELQKMIMRAISMDGGTCGLEKIYEYVKPRYDRLKRRDGSSYATNARRAIQASLSNNSSNRPIFQLVGTNDDEETLWSLTERGVEALEMINLNEPEQPFEEDSLDELNRNDESMDGIDGMEGIEPLDSSTPTPQMMLNSGNSHAFRPSSGATEGSFGGAPSHGPTGLTSANGLHLINHPHPIDSGSLSPTSMTSTTSDGAHTSDESSDHMQGVLHSGSASGPWRSSHQEQPSFINRVNNGGQQTNNGAIGNAIHSSPFEHSIF